MCFYLIFFMCYYFLILYYFEMEVNIWYVVNFCVLLEFILSYKLCESY